MHLHKRISIIALSGIAFGACTKLDEKLGSTLVREEAEKVIKVNSLLINAYNDMQLPFQDQSNFWALQEMTSDEAVAPTRGGDWDDNGAWRSSSSTPGPLIMERSRTHLRTCCCCNFRLRTFLTSIPPSNRQRKPGSSGRSACLQRSMDGDRCPIANPTRTSCWRLK